MYGKLVFQASAGTPAMMTPFLDTGGSDLMDLGIRFPGGGAMTYDDSPQVSSPEISPATLSWGESSYHFDWSTYQFDQQTFGNYTDTSWAGHSFSYDLVKSWSPWSVSTTALSKTDDFGGNELIGPGLDIGSSHSYNSLVFDQTSAAWGPGSLTLFGEHMTVADSLTASHLDIGSLVYNQTSSVHQDSMVLEMTQMMAGWTQTDNFASFNQSTQTQTSLLAPGHSEFHFAASSVHESASSHVFAAH